MKKNKFIFGVDAGTSVIKAVLFDTEGNEIISKAEKVDIISPQNNMAELNMNQVWKVTKKCIKKVTKTKIARSSDIIAIGLTGQGDGAWMISADGEPTNNAILWNDGRTGEIIDKWKEEGVLEKVWKINGTALFPGVQPAIIRWLKENNSKALTKTNIAFYCKDWLAYKMTGQVATDQTDASIPMLDISRRVYDPEIPKYFGIEDYKDLFPPLIASNKIRGKLKPKLAEKLNLKSGLPVTAGPLDVIACAVGTGSINEDIGITILGTTAFNGITVKETYLDKMNCPVGITFCHALKSKWMKGMATMCGTPNLDWFLNNLGKYIKLKARDKNLNIYTYAEKLIEKVPPGSRGIIYHPYILSAGERAPFVNTAARAQFIGLNNQHKLEDMLRSIYEGIALSIRDCYEFMPVKVKEIRLSGGGVKNRNWCQIIADVTGKKVKVPQGTEFGARGAAITAGIAIGLYDNYQTAVDKTLKIKEEYIPDIRNVKLYNQIYERYLSLRQKMEPEWKKLYKIDKNL